MGKLDELADSLAARFRRDIPNAAGGKARKLDAKQLEKRLDAFYAAAREVRRENKLWIVSWARVVLKLKQRLLDAGYPPSLVSDLIRSTLFQTAKAD